PSLRRVLLRRGYDYLFQERQIGIPLGRGVGKRGRLRRLGDRSIRVPRRPVRRRRRRRTTVLNCSLGIMSAYRDLAEEVVQRGHLALRLRALLGRGGNFRFQPRTALLPVLVGELADPVPQTRLLQRFDRGI